MPSGAGHAAAPRPVAGTSGRGLILRAAGACATALSVALLLSFFLTPDGPAYAARPGVPADALDAAMDWLVLLDAGKYAESWTLAGRDFRQGLGKAEWTRRMAAARSELGANTSRKPIDARDARETDPAGAAGKCLVILFGSVYEKVPYTTETLTLCREDGRWRVAGYFIR
ncbi:Protein of unknown function (DUF4019) [Desulfocurvibacter africanus PCS]|uniref:DUF4019 domain-containing protein n=1 Tax=Desulfocurvibacter africanus PCS TaxID=1262666 RepID=M5Q122_DESAF|nr:Protein of unknown function (DUF4019) [Desulfocurvibacter africanus PCS]